MKNTPRSTRPLSVAHLVFALVFLGIAAVWAIGEATDADLGHTAIGFPVVLIIAGIIGLVAAVAGSRKRRSVVVASVESTESEVDA